MKLLFDENLSPRLAALVSTEHPGSAHLASVGLRGATDQQVWDYALSQGFAIVSKDTDFRERSFVEGRRPKIIWLDAGNAGTAAIGDLILRARAFFDTFEADEERSLLILSVGDTAV